MAQDTGNMPPFPALDESTISRTPGEDSTLRNQMALYGGLPSNQPGGLKFQDSYLSNRLGELHKMHTDSAKRHYSNIQNYYYTLDSGSNPQTGEALSDEEKQSYQNQLNGAWDDLLKTPGLDKDAKAELQARRDMMDQVLTHGRSKVAHTMLGMMPPPPTPADQTATTSTTPNPTDVPAGAATSPDFEAQSWGQGGSPASAAAAPASDQTAPAGPQGVGGMPPLPTDSASAAPPASGGAPPHVLPGDMLNPFVSASVAQSAGTSAELAKRHAEATAAGLVEGSPEYQYKMANGSLPPWATSTGNYIDQDHPEKPPFTGRVVPGGVMDVATEQIVPHATKATAAEQAGRTIYNEDGVPTGVKRGGEQLTPNSKKWNQDDQDFLDASKEAWKTGEAGKDHRIKVAADARARSFAALRPVGVIDTLTGSLVEVTADQLADNPGRYAPAAQGVQMNNRKVLFDEINTATDLLNQSIAGLGDEAFDAGARAQMATIMSKEDPGVMHDAFNTFLRSSVAKDLTEPQIQYVTALENMQESALALRSVGGLGTGARDVRNAITNLLPSANTPTKAYAQRQMQLFQTEVGKLQQSILKLGNLPSNAGGGLTPPSPADPGMKWQHRTVNGKTEWKQVPVPASGGK